MSSIRRVCLTGLCAAGLLLSGTGCAVITTERVVSFVARKVAMEAGKQAWAKIKEDQRRREQTKQGSMGGKTVGGTSARAGA